MYAGEFSCAEGTATGGDSIMVIDPPPWIIFLSTATTRVNLLAQRCAQYWVALGSVAVPPYSLSLFHQEEEVMRR